MSIVKTAKDSKINLAGPLDALRDLHDQQNGPPWVGHEKKWQAAYDKAGEVLEESDK